jgi:polysaccharide export outer membrane protein
MRFLVLLMMLPLMAGCLPSSGPGRSAILAEEQDTVPEFIVIPLNQTIAELLAARPPESFELTFGMGDGVPELKIGVGDLVVVTIFEAASGGLFSGDPGAVGGTKSVSLPPQPVARDGTLSVPYVGLIRAAGRTPSEVGVAIEAALKDKAIEPQVVVTVTETVSSYVTVAGNAVGRVPLTLKGDRLLDVLVAAGGVGAQEFHTFVRLTRAGRSATVSLARIIRDPKQNIFARPDDLVYIYTDPQTYTAFGATAANAIFPIRTERVTLIDAVGEAGGLLDSRADPRSVFVFRFEDPELFQLISGARRGNWRTPAVTTAGVPAIYQIDLKDPVGYFAAQRFLMRDNDILYVTNAGAVDLQKLLSIVSGNLGTAVGTAATVRSLDELISDED